MMIIGMHETRVSSNNNGIGSGVMMRSTLAISGGEECCGDLTLHRHSSLLARLPPVLTLDLFPVTGH